MVATLLIWLMTLFTDPTPRIERVSRQAFAVITSVSETSERLGQSATAQFKGKTYSVTAIGDLLAVGDRGHFVEAGKQMWFIKAGSYYQTAFKKLLREWIRKAPAAAAIMRLMSGNKKKYMYKTGVITAVDGCNATVILAGETAEKTLPTKFAGAEKRISGDDVGKQCLVHFLDSGMGSVVAHARVAGSFNNLTDFPTFTANFVTSFFTFDPVSTYGTTLVFIPFQRYNLGSISIAPPSGYNIKTIRVRFAVQAFTRGFGVSADTSLLPPSEADMRTLYYYGGPMTFGLEAGATALETYWRLDAPGEVQRVYDDGGVFYEGFIPRAACVEYLFTRTTGSGSFAIGFPNLFQRNYSGGSPARSGTFYGWPALLHGAGATGNGDIEIGSNINIAVEIEEL